MHRDDQEFLPAALEILERPASPLGWRMLYFIMAIVVVALIWSWVSQTDIVAVGSGKVQPSGRVKTVQVVDVGKISRILAVNGQKVTAGQAVAEFEPDDAQADMGAMSAAVFHTRSEIIRRQHSAAVIGTALGHQRRMTWPEDIPREYVLLQEKVLTDELGAVLAQLKSIESQKLQKQAEIDKLKTMTAAQRAMLDILQERLDMRTALAGQNDVSRAQLLEVMEALTQQKITYLNQQGAIAEAVRALEVLDTEAEKLRKAFLLDNALKLADADRLLKENSARSIKAGVRVDRIVLRSPVDGVVHGSALTSVGQVLTPGQEVMRIVPTASQLEIEVYLPNKDIGFIEVGQAASIKVESFPFTRYGMLQARVIQVARDAVPEADAKQLEADAARSPTRMEIAGAQRVQGLVFPVVLQVDTNKMDIDGRVVELVPGMAVTAEIKTGQRRVLEYLFTPLLEVTNRAMRER
jgi:hemolysin D